MVKLLTVLTKIYPEFSRQIAVQMENSGAAFYDSLTKSVEDVQVMKGRKL